MTDTQQVLRCDWATAEAARYACIHWHYSKSVPAGKMVRVGVWERATFVGVVLFSRGANNNIGRPYRLTQLQICELTRVALSAHETPVSRIMAIAVRFLVRQSPDLRCILSYADPAQGHHGGIYQAGNWLYVGHSTATRHLIVNGAPMHMRTASSAFGTASPQQITALTGAPARWDVGRWKYTYLLPLDNAMRAQLAPLALPYPRREVSGNAPKA